MPYLARSLRGCLLLAVVAITAHLPLEAASAAETEGAPDGGTLPRSEVRTVVGKVISIAPAHHSIALSTEGGPIELELDRNTSVFLASRLGTIRDLAVGSPVRASFGTDRRAFWIEVTAAEGPARPRGSHSDAGTAAGPPVLAAPGDPAAGPRPR